MISLHEAGRIILLRFRLRLVNASIFLHIFEHAKVPRVLWVEFENFVHVENGL